MFKLALAYILMGTYTVLMADVSQQGGNAVQIIMAVTGLITALGIIYNIWMTNKGRGEVGKVKETVTTLSNKQIEVASKIDGLLEKKEVADKAAGAKEEKDKTEKTATDIQTGVDQEKGDQALRDLPPK